MNATRQIGFAQIPPSTPAKAQRRGHRPGLRDVVFARDGGICARCGLDCKPIDDLIEAHCAEAVRRSNDRLPLPTLRLLRDRVFNMFSRPWHVHHVIPIAEGGTHDMSNLMTLCYPCHREVHSAAYRKRLARRSAASQAISSEVAR